MDGTKWTPGPWGYEWDENSVLVTVDLPRGRYTDGPDGRQFQPDTRTIVTLHAATGWDAEADARLIAAAPDLYEALEASIQYLEEAMSKTYWSDASDFVVRARAALARARGDAQ